MHFHLLVNGEPRPAEITIGGAAEIAAIGRWRVPKQASRTAAVLDTLEFAKLASKRWRYYRDHLPVATSETDLRSMFTKDALAEISVLFAVRCEWFPYSTVMGFAQCRRTYCHHMVLEFLATHPRIVSASNFHVRGVGSGLVCALAELAHSLGMKAVWGEATAISAPFYAKLLSIPNIDDYFVIRDDVMDHCRAKFREEMMGRA